MTRTRLMLAAAAALLPLAGCADYGYGPAYGPVGYAPPPPPPGPYYADEYYHPGRAYRLRANDYVYRGRDGRYYCRRPDGTTGLIVGGIAGGLLGNIIAPGGSETLGTLLGATGGALAGRAIQRDRVVCR